MVLNSFGKLQTFARHDDSYIIYDMQMNNISIQCHFVADIRMEENTKYGYETWTSGDSDKQFMIA